MSTTTANYNLVKPDYGDVADISVINKNMDVLDDELKKLTDEVNSNIEDINNSIDGTNANVASNTEAITQINEDYLSKSQKGAVSGIAELDENGKVATSQLPSYVDDVLEFNTIADFPETGESGKIYVTLDTNLSYRWGGTAYVEISKSLALGETQNTAFRGDYGKVAYEHTNKKDNPHDVTKSQVGLANVDNTADVDKPVSKATQELLDNLAVGVASGESITVQDSAGAPFSSFGMTGKSTQKIYTGKNLINFYPDKTEHNGITCVDNGDGSFTLNGTNSGSESLFSLPTAKDLMGTVLMPNTEYIGSILGPKNENGIQYLRFQVYQCINSAWEAICYTETKNTFSYSEEATDLIIRIQVAGGVTLPNTIKLQ